VKLGMVIRTNKLFDLQFNVFFIYLGKWKVGGRIHLNIVMRMYGEKG